MLRTAELAKAFGGRVLFQGLDLHVRPRDRIGLVGRNGSGKTTLLRVLAGLEPADDGRISCRRGAAVRYLRQEIDPGSERPVIEEARRALEGLRALAAEISRAEEEIAALGRAGRSVPRALAERYDRLGVRF